MPWGACAVCHAWRPLGPNGQMQAHKAISSTSDNDHADLCVGSGQAPEAVQQ